MAGVDDVTPPSGPLRRSVAGLFAPSVPWLILPSCICWALLLWPLAYHSLQLVDRDVALMLANAVDGLRELLGKASEEGPAAEHGEGPPAPEKVPEKPQPEKEPGKEPREPAGAAPPVLEDEHPVSMTIAEPDPAQPEVSKEGADKGTGSARAEASPARPED